MLSRKIFIIHGHHEGTKKEVAYLISRLGFEPVILHEQSNKGRTIIEKFEAEAEDVSYAIAILTADDMGYPIGPQGTPRPRFRPRQNVVFELGFFIGKLGRERVAVLYRNQGMVSKKAFDPNVRLEIPSDYQGVVYIEMDDAGKWQIKLAKEMKAAGLSVQLEKLPDT